MGRIKNTRTPFSIDFGVGDVIVPGHAFTVGQFEQVTEFVNDEAMQKKWNAFCRKIDTDTEDYGIVGKIGKLRFYLKKDTNSCYGYMAKSMKLRKVADI